jgi:hypothetical protein
LQYREIRHVEKHQCCSQSELLTMEAASTVNHQQFSFDYVPATWQIVVPGLVRGRLGSFGV